MDRRNFIRLVGGGTVGAAGALLLPGCSADYPAAAVAASSFEARMGGGL